MHNREKQTLKNSNKYGSKQKMDIARRFGGIKLTRIHQKVKNENFIEKLVLVDVVSVTVENRKKVLTRVVR